MGVPKRWKGQVTGHVYDLEHGEKINPETEGIGCAGCGSAPSAVVNGREKYSRVFIRLRTPEEILTYRPIEDGADFARRAAALEKWFNTFVRDRDVVLNFEVLSPEAADGLEEFDNIEELKR